MANDRLGVIDSCGSGPLAPGSTTSCTASYTVTRDDVFTGSVLSTAFVHTASAISPSVRTIVTNLSPARRPRRRLS